MTRLRGHEDAWATWRGAMRGGRMHHAWILAGRRGLGKAQFAYRAASELVAEDGHEQLPATGHPDILGLTPLAATEDEEKKRLEGKAFLAKRNISVEQIRQMQRRLTTRPTMGARRAIVIDAADDLEKSAFNALLKSLEEPPQGTFFLLIAHQAGRLPATIRSRCRILRFADLPDELIDGILVEAAPDSSNEERRAARMAANGSPGAALAFLDRGLGNVQHLFERLAGEGDADLALRGQLAGEIGPRPDREKIAAVLEAARMVLVRALPDAEPGRQRRIVAAHGKVSTLIGQAPVYNFDPGILMLEIGGLLASTADPRDAAH
ncbi:DNA polymerase III subunit delta' [Novosphingobium tardum]|uniref:DNA polymerase III subunit delta n=1 Tax=Novosphingobium tardum TaxID=1538021 RepID=A0ABV8RQM0_9SPHN